MVMLLLSAGAGAEAPRALRPVVEVEEEVYRYAPADNGASPMWCHGNTCIVRVGEDVFASGIETLTGRVPLNNVRWMLFRRGRDGWRRLADGGETHEREPCPLACFPQAGRIFLSTNPNDCKPDQRDGRATPQVLDFRSGDATAKPAARTPKWNGRIRFHAHTYRSFAADAARKEMVLFYNTGYDRTYWTFRDAAGRWAATGELKFPFGAEYDKPQPIRICYPAVQLKDRAVHLCGVSDIVEPYRAWREHKRKLTGRSWDYDFRRLFYTWTDDVTKGGFHEWVEIASRDRTCGRIFPCDLWIGPDGRVHLLWTERAIDPRLREKFFPDARQGEALNYAVVRGGEVLLRKAVLGWKEGETGDVPGRGRFHVTPGGRLLVLYHVGRPRPEQRLVEIGPAGPTGKPVKVPLKQPLASFFTATVRAGCAPADAIDVLGEAERSLRYARIRLW
jgi:hypothetical protein